MDDEKYILLKQKYKQWDDLAYKKEYNLRIEYSEQVQELLESIDNRALNKMIKSELEKGYQCYYHSVFGCIDKKNNAVSEIKDRINKDTNKDLEQLQKMEPFIKKLNSITYCDIYTYSDHLKRYRVSEIPEIKPKNITRNFNRSTLPAYISLDIETTGLRGGQDRIIQIAAALIEDDEITEVFATYINPGRHIPEEITEINKITDEDVFNAPTIDEISRSLKEFVGSLPIVGYNIGFDLKFIFCAGIDFISNRKIYDVCDFARRVLKDSNIESFTLVNVADDLNIVFPPHNAISDCVATHEIFQTLLSIYCNE